MKKVTLMACLFMASASFAQTGVRTIGSVESFQTKLEQRIQTPAMTQLENGAYVLDKGQKATEKPSLSAFVNKAMLSEQELHVMAEQSKIETLDSIVSSQESTGYYYSKQQFEYYESNQYPKERINSLWDANMMDWNPVEKYHYEWDKDGYCTVQEGFNLQSEFGSRIVYTYNEQKLGIFQVMWQYDCNVSDEWYMVQKGAYEYNDNGDMLSETLFNYVDEEWIPLAKNVATYDDNHRMLTLEPYKWDGAKWVAGGDKSEYAYDEYNNTTLLSYWSWNDEINDWQNWRRIEFHFLNGDPEKAYLTDKKHWNSTYQNWSGAELRPDGMYYNDINETTYDEKGRKVYSQFTQCLEAGPDMDKLVYLKGAYTIDEYTELENGLTEKEEKRYLCKEVHTNLEEDQFIDDTVWRYNADGQEVYMYSKHINTSTGALVDYEAHEKDYSEKGELLRDYKFVFGSSQASATVYTYDDFSNVLTQQVLKKRENANNDEGWTNGNRFEWEWDAERGVMLDKKGYMWNGVDFTPSWGEGYRYDFDADMSKIYVWIGGDMQYKLLETRSYAANDGEWDYIGFKYYYSEVEVEEEDPEDPEDPEAGIDTNIANSGIRVYPTCVDNCLYVDANEDVNVNIYSLQGACVISTNEKAISVSDLANGIYLVEVNGYKTKIVKK